MPPKKTAPRKSPAEKPDMKRLADAARRPRVTAPAKPAFDHFVSAKQPGQKTILESRRLRAPKGESHHQLKIGVPGALIASIQAHSENPAAWGGALLRLADYALHELVAKGKTLESLPNEYSSAVAKPQMSDSKAASAVTIKRKVAMAKWAVKSGSRPG
ncbi:hypothetical protein KPL74_11015 [Bacillus sp. NP157]|nr:hypothetical protein KPL74_11015 [Bacillus sp. NP157]